MKKIIAALLAGSTGLIFAVAAFAVTPAQEKAFLDSYRKAFTSRDVKALEAMLYSKGADPMALDFYKMMIAGDLEATITSMTLADLTAEDVKKLETARTPDGRPMKMTLKPVKKLVLKTSTKTASSSSTGSRESFVAEHEGKLVIPVPASGK
jgi:hypothetical protein